MILINWKFVKIKKIKNKKEKRKKEDGWIVFILTTQLKCFHMT